jgi:hypothetical protein
MYLSRRLGVVLRKLTTSSELLAPMLGGLDVAEMMALPPPLAGYELVYSIGSASTLQLQEELEGLRLMALHRRAVEGGVNEKSIEDAMDGEAPKPELIELIIRQLDAQNSERVD